VLGEGEIMRVVTLLGAVIALALGSTSCQSSGVRVSDETTVGAEARDDEAYREREADRKGKMEEREPSEVREAEREAEEEAQEGKIRRMPDNPMRRQLNVLDQPNPTNP
jgi:F0F1-type ATP synthase epsilon subunit